MFAPSASAKALIGVADGTYQVTVEPSKDNDFYLGPNFLSLPRNSVCELGKSTYGPAFWNDTCTTQRQPFTLTVVISGAQSNHPSMHFLPAMRFNPHAQPVQLFMYAPHVSPSDAKNWVMLYCPTTGACLDESLSDNTLTTHIDYHSNMVFRRVKHFSGYTVAEFADGLPL